MEIKIKLTRSPGGGMRAEWLVEPTITNALEVEYAEEIEQAFHQACARVAARHKLTPTGQTEPVGLSGKLIGNG